MALVLALAALCLPASASAATDTFTNANGIGINDGGNATPYPSAISVGGLNTPISDVNATLTGLSHPCFPDLDILLVGPGGQNTLLLSDSGGCPGGNPTRGLDNTATVTLDDEALSLYPCGDSPSGSFKPTDDACAAGRTAGDFFPSPGPGAGAFPAFLGVFDGTNPNGTWNLYVVDQFGDCNLRISCSRSGEADPTRGNVPAPGDGAIASWSVTITTPNSSGGGAGGGAGGTAGVTAAGSAPICFGEVVTRQGTTGDDVVEGTPKSDVIATHAGNDRVTGLEKDDIVCAGRGDDTVNGGPEDDILIGGKGNDDLNGGTGNDRLFGGSLGSAASNSGADDCRGGSGDDKTKGCESGSP